MFGLCPKPPVFSQLTLPMSTVPNSLFHSLEMPTAASAQTQSPVPTVAEEVPCLSTAAQGDSIPSASLGWPQGTLCTHTSIHPKAATATPNAGTSPRPDPPCSWPPASPLPFTSFLRTFWLPLHFPVTLQFETVWFLPPSSPRVTLGKVTDKALCHSWTLLRFCLPDLHKTSAA